MSGSLEGLSRFQALSSGLERARIIPLNVSGAFHSKLMASAAQKLKLELDQLTLREPLCPMSMNVLGAIASDAHAVGSALIRQIAEPLRFMDAALALCDEGAKCFIEVGPKTVVKGLLKKINPGLKLFSFDTARDILNQSDLFEFAAHQAPFQAAASVE